MERLDCGKVGHLSHTEFIGKLLGSPWKWKLTQGFTVREKTFENLVSGRIAPPLETFGVVLRSYKGEEVKPKGTCMVQLSFWTRTISVGKGLAGNN